MNYYLKINKKYIKREKSQILQYSKISEKEIQTWHFILSSSLNLPPRNYFQEHLSPPLNHTPPPFPLNSRPTPTGTQSCYRNSLKTRAMKCDSCQHFQICDVNVPLHLRNSLFSCSGFMLTQITPHLYPRALFASIELTLNCNCYVLINTVLNYYCYY